MLPATVMTLPLAMAHAAEALKYKTLERRGFGATDNMSAPPTKTASERFALVDSLAATASVGSRLKLVIWSIARQYRLRGFEQQNERPGDPSATPISVRHSTRQLASSVSGLAASNFTPGVCAKGTGNGTGNLKRKHAGHYLSRLLLTADGMSSFAWLGSLSLHFDLLTGANVALPACGETRCDVPSSVATVQHTSVTWQGQLQN